MSGIRKNILLLLCAVSALASGVSEAATFTLKSARAVTAEVSEDASRQSVRVSVQFIPVTSLDALGNERMNLVVSRFFAEQALSQFYGKEKGINFNRLKHSVEKATVKQKRKYVYVVPFSAISDAVVKVTADKKVINSSYSGNTDDDNLLSASEIFNRDLRLAEAYFQQEIKEKDGKEALSKNVNDALDALKKKVGNQDDLLSSEKEEFVEKIEKVRKYLLKKLRKSSDRAAGSVASGRDLSAFISNYAIHSDFEKILANDKILLEYGGCRAVRLEDGRIALIGIGTAAVTDNSARERLQLMKVAEHRAFAALAEHKAVDVTSFASLTESTTVSAVNKNESAKDQRTLSTSSSVKAAAYFSYMETVGCWHSKDGKMFFLAKGCIIKPSN